MSLSGWDRDGTGMGQVVNAWITCELQVDCMWKTDRITRERHRRAVSITILCDLDLDSFYIFCFLSKLLGVKIPLVEYILLSYLIGFNLFPITTLSVILLNIVGNCMRATFLFKCNPHSYERVYIKKISLKNVFQTICLNKLFCYRYI